MAKKLVIVESPAKAKTIEKFLGRDFEVRASMGHISELPAASRRADEIYIAPDPDREGEFIAWSLKETLGLQHPRRAVFNEITKGAVQQAIRKPREINEDLFNAQQARRVLDRLVGYKISPLLWRRVQSGTSAGRVQSVAVRLICEREAEIRAFVPEEYWTIVAHLSKQKQRKTFEAQLFARLSDENAEQPEAQAAGKNGKNGNGKNGKAGNGDEPERTKIKIGSEDEAKAILAELEGA